MQNQTHGGASGASKQATALDTSLPFVYRLVRSSTQDAKTFVLLHGSGVDETILLPFARGIAPDATLLAPRARIPQEDGWRWFERVTPTRFGQHSIRAEAAAFADFLGEAAGRHGIDLADAIFLGYSNGANLVTSIMLLHPGLVRRAVLLRPMPVLDHPPATMLTGIRALVIAGKHDVTYAPFAPALLELLGERGAEVEAHMIDAGHEFGEVDAAIVRDWLERDDQTSSA